MNGSENVAEIFRNVSQVTLVQIVLIILGAWGIIALLARFLPMVANRITGRARFNVLALVPVFRLLVIVAAAVMIFNLLIEPTIENLIALLGLIGLGLGFAFKDYISSLIAGMITLYEAPYRPGDWVEIEGAYGEVRAINMRSAEIVTPDDTVVVIPHLTVWNKLIYNANDGGRNLQCVADFYLHPDHDGRQVEQILYDVAYTSAWLQFDQPVSVIVQEKPWATHYRLKAYPVDPRHQFRFITDLTLRGKEALRNEEIRFLPSPAYAEGSQPANPAVHAREK
ncbi:mechanosensitive ion channel [Prosthecochloris sp. N3]|uniref:Mechanosensitive ion channel n=1 Tax=Prosthecochloris ethylica TaxID=2743976 RepID=A0ABR9XSD6_9CHLB|nr:mechanosensitive ion channel domain-containing protein [Prosthecochloris ethylica]MBF0586674.1 mechanosensitive ion channel [Prosthecochloris ethylica]MBF0636972.1 mechanosensitive ion channel [Prosthecochloris ethylica]NUK47843.1 mechanosensitive ion channel [Prosthecochloris ethylica]